ncbi:uncharacterized protein ARMOST_11448 [Armillaria ostoyae]|uniref:Uncharacterized protein n=1 Tax=Armillaria ostoyae TaxID=47428 RepID=A0A284RH52_ARMOS|nr:uncharacterized protein ARMOST_11448 [Armillaria ostoyae]
MRDQNQTQCDILLDSQRRTASYEPQFATWTSAMSVIFLMQLCSRVLVVCLKGQATRSAWHFHFKRRSHEDGAEDVFGGKKGVHFFSRCH